MCRLLIEIHIGDTLRRSFAACLVILCIVGGAGAVSPTAEDNYQVSTWRTEHGLPSDQVRAITQDSDGYLWVATPAGLASFDGLRFRGYPPSADLGVQTASIVALLGDADGRVWATSAKGGLASIKGGRFEVHIPDREKAGKLISPVFVNGGEGVVFIDADGVLQHWRDGGSVKIGSDKRLVNAVLATVVSLGGQEFWLMTTEGDLARVEDGAFEFFSPSHWGLAGSSWRGLARGAEGEVLAATEASMARLEGDRFVEVPMRGILGPIIKMKNSSDGGATILMTPSTVFRLAGGEWVPMPGPPPGSFIPQTPKIAEHLGGTGSLWIAFARQALLHLRPDRNSKVITLDDGLPGDNLYVLFEDVEGSLWIGGGSFGLGRVRRKLAGTLGPRQRGFNGWCTTGIEHDGAIWIGSYQDGLEEWRDGVWTRHLLDDFPGPVTVRAISTDRRGGLWVGTERHGVVADLGSGFSAVIPQEKLRGAAACLFGDLDDRLWICSTGASFLSSAEDWSEVEEVDALAGHDIRAVTQTADGDMWFGTWERSVNRGRDGLFEQVLDEGEFRGARITCLLPRQGGGIWIGTSGDGIGRYDGEELVWYGKADGMPSTTVSHIADDACGNLWLGTSQGIVRVAISDLEALSRDRELLVAWTIFDETDGLPTRQCSWGNYNAGWVTADGRLCFATYSGVGIVDPTDSMIRTRPARPLVMSVVSGAGELVAEGGIYVVPSDSASVEIDFDMPSLSTPQKVKFRHRLVGFDSQWHTAGRGRAASFTNLSPGRYRFEVMATDAGGEWGDPAGIELKVVVPFWKRPWVIVGSVLLSIAIGVFLSRWFFTRRMRRRLRETERREALVNERNRIASDLHDEIGSGLTCITFLSGSTPGEVQGGDGQLGKIREVATDLTKTLDEIVWAVSPRHDNLESLASYFAGRAQTLLGAAEIRCRLDIPVDLPLWELSAEQRHELFFAFSEALNNVVKHSGATESRVRLAVLGDDLVLSVDDNGCGINDSAAGGEGLINMRERMERIGGSCTIEALADGGGTRVVLRLRPQRLSSPGRHP